MSHIANPKPVPAMAFEKTDRATKNAATGHTGSASALLPLPSLLLSVIPSPLVRSKDPA
eukprot:CAMPEP_0172370772 /NCGR_PEP_ID=MMETSP1060-20121228/39587_1 /TAXON_ID=37318 /ORGANISM="Pseudo-nitzschia pungens, Strain cf. cingulata" /LENGTH=58 /DNA_ID=CAMNT_0013096157 /DNA_START=62 /DNA_END=234 /DNA_ORIENTATION=-